MSSAIIKFFTGNTSQLASMTNNLSSYIAFNTETGSLWWNYNGNKYYLNYIADWNQSDSSSPAFIKNKPDLLTIQDLIGVLDVSQLADATNMITSCKVPIDPSNVIEGAGGKFLYTIGKRAPSGIMTTNAVYDLQPSTVTVDANNNITIDLSNYMAYENVTSVPSTWALWYA